MTEAGDLLPFGYVVRHDKHDPDGSFYRTNVLTEADKAAGYTITPVYTRAPITPSVDKLVEELNDLPMLQRGMAFEGYILSSPQLDRILAALQPPAADNATGTEDGLAGWLIPGAYVGAPFKSEATDEDGGPLWECYVETPGGWGVVAEVCGGSEREAKVRAEAVCRALNGEPASTEAVNQVERLYRSDREEDWVAAELLQSLTALRTTGQPAIAAADNGALERAKEAISAAKDILTEAPELNMSNYDHDEVDALNKGAIEAWQVLDQALAALEAPGMLPAEGWRPIETAPKDGTPILICLSATSSNGVYGKGGHRTIHTAVFEDDLWALCDTASPVENSSWEVTHWRPLPEPPAKPVGEADV